MPTQPMRVGLIVPSSNTVMEPDFHRHLGQIALVSTARIFLTDVTREAEMRMLEEDLPRAVEQLRTTGPEVWPWRWATRSREGCTMSTRPWHRRSRRMGTSNSTTTSGACMPPSWNSGWVWTPSPSSMGLSSSSTCMRRGEACLASTPHPP